MDKTRSTGRGQVMRERKLCGNLSTGLLAFALCIFLAKFPASAAEPSPTPTLGEGSVQSILEGEEFQITNVAELEWDGETFLVTDLVKRAFAPSLANKKTIPACTATLPVEGGFTYPKHHEYLAVLAATSFLVSSALISETDLPSDKKKHYLAGVVVGAGSAGFARLVLRRDTPNYALKSALIGLGTSVFIAVGKEVYDKKTGRGFAERKDAYFTIAGGIHGTLSIQLLDLKKLFVKESKR